MFRNKEKPFGKIYRATNIHNEKIYFGQTTTSRWGDDKNPIEERWKEEVGEAYRKERRGEELRYIEHAIIKHGEESFELKEEDIAHSQEELDEKETHYINKYDTMNPEKGYNLKEGGRGGRLSEQAKDNLSRIGEKKWQNDQEYREKQTSERQERAKDQEWLDKMADVNQEIARNPETLEKMSESLSEKWKDQEYQESVSQGVTGKWQESEYREKQFKSRVEGKREIEDKAEFLRDIQDMKKKDLNEKHNMDGKCMNRRIKGMLGHRGVNNFSQAKKYLEGKNLQNVLKDINKNMKTKSQEFTRKKEISNKREFLQDIQNMKTKDIAEKYNMNRTTVNKRIQEMLGDKGVKNSTELKSYLNDKNLDDVVKDINERMSDQSQKYEGKSEITNKRELLEDIQNLQKNEIDMKYKMDGKTINRKINEMLGDQGVNNYSEAKNYLQDKKIEDVVKDIESRSNEMQDNTQIPVQKPEEGESNEPFEENSEKSPDGDKEEAEENLSDETISGKDYDGINDSSADKGEVTGNNTLKSTEDVNENEKMEMNSIFNEEWNKAHNNLGEKLKDSGNRGFVDNYGRSNDDVVKIIGDIEPVRGPSSSIASDYDGIDNSSESESEDFRGIDDGFDEGGKDYEGIDDQSGEGSEDYQGIDEEHGGSEYGGEA